ncbi:MAG: ferrous iron transport protein B [Planctomycetes bacterium]|nr:ferrous iron transport protein B [Planctomycetota bacterium]
MTTTSPPARRSDRAALRIALAGNPNAGKTTLFNRLTGSSAKVANHPGITVDIEEGRWALPARGVATLVDVPGAYSLSAHSSEERVAIAAIAGLPPCQRPNAVVVVADATELARHLYLVLQILELDLPSVLALTMVDRLERGGQDVDTDALSQALGVPVVRVCVHRDRGILELGRAIESVLAEGWRPAHRDPFPEPAPLHADVEAIAAAVPPDWHAQDPVRARALARWALLTSDEPDATSGLPPQLIAAAHARRTAAHAAGRDVDAEMIGARYAWIDERLRRFVRTAPGAGRTRSERVDDLLLHPVAGFTIFAALMTLVFQALFVGADPFIGWIEDGVAALAASVSGWLGDGLLRDFLVGGVIEGVGAVLVFLPQILLMFLFLGLLEDTGYMARIVFLMDRVMKSVGLHGRAFVPLMSGFACAVPAILATRTMERRRDRLLTMLVVPLMTCSARLPVYGLLIAALYPIGSERPLTQGLLMAAMYVFSVVVALAAAAVFGRTLLRGKQPPLVQQMPPYRLPNIGTVWKGMLRRAGVFVREAGTVILLCTIGMWALLSFPRELAPPVRGAFDAQRAEARAQAAEDPSDTTEARLVARLGAIDAEEEGARLRASWAGRLGHTLEPAIAPLGFDWEIGVGLIGAFAAREVFVSTMAIVYGLDGDQDETSVPLRVKLREQRRPDGTRVFTPRTILSLLVFFALACQCLSTLAAARRESGGYAWPLFMFGYMTVLAWVTSFVTYQGLGLLGVD